MSVAKQTNSSKIREALEKALSWADVEVHDLPGEQIQERHDDIALALGILHKWREEEA
jgi:hypothetical protein